MRRLMALLPLALLACDDGGGSTTPTADAGISWHGEVAPLVLEHCAGCHRPGGAGPFALDSFEAAAPLAGAMVAAVAAGRMPPWSPDPDCRDYREARILPPGALETLRAWAEAGAPEGEASGPGFVPPEDGFEPTLVARSAEPYLPDASGPDDYRCLVLDAEFPEDTFVYGVNVVPDQGALVHHVLLYAIPPGDVPALLALDEADEGPGYGCFGGIEVGFPTSLGGWVPGAAPQVWPGDTANALPAGSRIVMQVHYNLLTAEPAPDQTEVHFDARPDTPTFTVRGTPLAALDLEIPAGDPAATITREFEWYGEETLEVLGVVGHMHLLGAHMSLEVVRPDDADLCMLRIPDWDFAWQEMYAFEEVVPVRPGDRLRLSCTFDNSAGNQPTVNGEQLEPRDVSWGEGTLDEMCFASLVLRSAYDPAQQAQQRCAGVDACRAACDDADDLDCLLGCTGADLGCARCVVEAKARCGGASCLPTLEAARDCLTACLVFSGDVLACLRDRCPAEYDAAATCIDEATADGSCAAPIQACMP